jgi:HSP20 family protein
MALTPYRPSGDLLAPFFDDLFSGGNRMGDLLRAPHTDVMETDREIRVTAEMPGLRPEDISIELENNVLTISGEKKEERREGDEGRWHLSERRYGRFSRSFVLPRDVEQDQIQARCDNGVLEVTVPKSERARRRRIDIGSHPKGEVSEAGERTQG